MIRKKVPEGIDRPAATIHDNATLAAYNNMPISDFPQGVYTVAVYAEGGAGAPQWESYGWLSQGGGVAGGRAGSPVTNSVWHFYDKPVVEIGTGVRQWDGTKAPDARIGSVIATGGDDGLRGAAGYSPAPTGSSATITIYSAGSDTTKVVSRGGKGYEFNAPNTLGLRGAVQRRLLAGVL